MQTILNENVILCYPYEHPTEGMPKDYVPPPQIDNMTAVKEMIRLGRIMPLITLLGERGREREGERDRERERDREGEREKERERRRERAQQRSGLVSGSLVTWFSPSISSE